MRAVPPTGPSTSAHSESPISRRAFGKTGASSARVTRTRAPGATLAALHEFCAAAAPGAAVAYLHDKGAFNGGDRNARLRAALLRARRAARRVAGGARKDCAA